MAERDAALRAAFAELSPPCQQPLAMLFSDPPHSYAQISATLGIPMGSIGPQRAAAWGGCAGQTPSPPSVTGEFEDQYSRRRARCLTAGTTSSC